MAEQASQVNRIEDLDTIIDADAHVTEKVADFLPYMDDRYEVTREHIKTEENRRPNLYSTSKPYPTVYNTHESLGDVFKDQKSFTYSDTRDPNEKLKEMGEFSIDYSIVQPTLNNSINTVNDPTCAIALANAYNSWIIDEFLDEHDSIKGSIVVAPHRPDKAAEEIDDRASEEGMVAVALSSASLIPPAGDHKYDPIYQAAQDNGLPIVHHGTSHAMAHHFPRLGQHLQNNAEGVGLSHAFQTMSCFATTMLRGVPERFPDLQIVFQEAGISWVPYWIWRNDDQYFHKGEELFHLKKPPSEYIDGQIYFTTQPVGHIASNPKYLGWAIEMAGADSVMYSADLPHATFDPPEELFNPIKSHFDSETLRKIMGETAADVFDL